ncbi:MAG TPA: response regulator [Myxococcales bacterium]|nr:response regulator [Myxococcales bacterium]
MPRILVIDDEQTVALMIRRALEEDHEVTVEHSALGAVDRIARGERYDALIADLNLADGDAIWIRDELRRIDPALPSRLLVLTGGASTKAGQAFLEEPGVRWLQKPFRARELQERLEEVLGKT